MCPVDDNITCVQGLTHIKESELQQEMDVLVIIIAHIS